MNKEAYIEYVRDYKRTLHILVPFQRYLKRYLRKTLYPVMAYELDKKEIDAAAKKLGWDAEMFYPENKEKLYSWELPSRIDILRSTLRDMQELRVENKEHFKKSQEIEKVA